MSNDSISSVLAVDVTVLLARRSVRISDKFNSGIFLLRYCTLLSYPKLSLNYIKFTRRSEVLMNLFSEWDPFLCK